MNVSGHRISTTEVESALVDHPTVAEAAVVGAKDDTTGQAIIAFVTLQGRHRAERPSSARSSASTWPSKIGADRPARRRSSSPTTCPRPARQDHAPPAARRGRGPRPGRHHHARRPACRGDPQAGRAPTPRRTDCVPVPGRAGEPGGSRAWRRSVPQTSPAPPRSAPSRHAGRVATRASVARGVRHRLRTADRASRRRIAAQGYNTLVLVACQHRSRGGQRRRHASTRWCLPDATMPAPSWVCTSTQGTGRGHDAARGEVLGLRHAGHRWADRGRQAWRRAPPGLEATGRLGLIGAGASDEPGPTSSPAGGTGSHPRARREPSWVHARSDAAWPVSRRIAPASRVARHGHARCRTRACPRRRRGRRLTTGA